MRWTAVMMCMMLASLLRGQTWQWIGPDSVEINHLFAKQDTLYATTRKLEGVYPNQRYVGTIVRTVNAGARWDTISTTLPSTRFRDYELRDITAFAVDPTDLQTIYAAVSGLLYKTINAGGSWRLLSDTSNQVLQSARYVAISPYNRETIFAIDRLPAPAGNLDNLFRSTDGGMSWQFVGEDFPVSSHGVEVEIAFGPLDSTKMYAVANNSYFQMFFKSTDGGTRWRMLSYCEGFKITFTQKKGGWNILNYLFGLYRSTDQGLSWFRLAPDMGFLDIKPLSQISERLYSVARSPFAFDYGVYFSSDGGESWSLLEGSVNLQLYEDCCSRDIHSVIALDEVNSVLYAGTRAGVFRYSIPTFIHDGVSIPTDYQLYQNYPNPFNPATTIKYSIPQRVFVRLVVYDILGREVKVLVDTHQEAGTHSTNFSAQGLQSGVYFYRLTAGRYTEVKKMVVLK